MITLTCPRAVNLLNHLLLCSPFLELHVEFPDENMIVLSAGDGILALGRECDSVDWALVAGQRVDGPGLQQVVDLDLPVTGPGHAVVPTGVERQTIDARVVSVVELLELPGSDVEYLDVVVTGGHAQAGSARVELTVLGEAVVDVEGVERLAGDLVPHLHSLVVTATGQESPVWRPADRPHPVVVLGETLLELLPLDRPQFDRLVVRG